MVSPRRSQIQPDLFLRLPRELRDPIYYHVLKSSNPIPLKDSCSNGIPSFFRKNSTLYAEALEASYRVNTFTLTLHPASDPDLLSNAWGPYPHAKALIRHLIVTADECFPPGCSYEEYEEQHQGGHDRRRWAQFLEVPHLESLTINMQKSHEDNLCTLDFGPIIYHLRRLHPNLELTFCVSFDTLLRDLWNDPIWATSAYVVPDFPQDYKPMGYKNMSSLIALPTDDDESYVAQYLPDRRLRPPPSLKQGLLDETPEGRRSLATFYVVKEASLLRLQMQQHYEVYVKYKKEKSQRAAGQ
jgi:hypothetical protein